MNGKKTKLLVLAALFTALTTVATMVIQIPSPMNGYVNLGDCVVLLSAWVLGPWLGAAAGGLGSMLADIISGYAYYALGTLLIKAAMALVAGLIFRAAAGRGRRGELLIQTCGAALAEVIMVLGYFGYAGLLLGEGWGAALSIPGNLIQAAFGLVIALALIRILERSRAIEWISR